MTVMDISRIKVSITLTSLQTQQSSVTMHPTGYQTILTESVLVNFSVSFGRRLLQTSNIPLPCIPFLLRLDLRMHRMRQQWNSIMACMARRVEAGGRLT